MSKPSLPSELSASIKSLGLIYKSLFVPLLDRPLFSQKGVLCRIKVNHNEASSVSKHPLVPKESSGQKGNR